MKKDSCQTVLLDDEPSSSDLFGGAHKKLADAIASLIYNERGGITIGLEGGWGSGKSTVIKMLGELLKNPKKEKKFS